MAPQVNYELAHVLFLDVVGYSKLLIDDQQDVLRRLNSVVRGTEQFRAAERAKKLISLPTGDGMVIAFYTAPDAAARCAIEIARALCHAPEIKLRMGIHCGPVSSVTDVNEHANVAGGGINIAQRVMDCGDAGHILLSQRVAEDLAEFREWNSSVHDLGECQVKHDLRLHLFNFFGDGFGNPSTPAKLAQIGREKRDFATSIRRPNLRAAGLAGIVLVLLALAALVLRSSRWRRAAPDREGASVPEKSIAVLPFENLSDDKSNAYFVDGIQDEILTRLSKIADLKVISRTSTQQFKSKPGNLSEIARQLGVANILEGSAQRATDQVRVNVQLIRASSDAHLWAETYDRKLTDVFGVESEIATKIADTLQAKLTGAEHQAMTSRPTENVEAHELYLKGRFFAGKRQADGLQRAIHYYEQAVAKDPNYAAAYAGIATSYTLLQEYSNLPRSDVFLKAHEAAAKALTIDNNLAEAHAALALVLVEDDLNFKAARHEFERAIALNPNSPDARYFYGVSVLAPLGQFDQAVVEITHAISLDPFSPIMNANLGYTYTLAGRYPEAIAQLRKTVELDPTFPFSQGTLGLALWMGGEKEAAEAQLQHAVSVVEDSGGGGEYHAMALLSYIYGRQGQREKALELLDKIKRLEERQNIVWAYGYSMIQIGLGDQEAAIDWLERSYQAKDTGAISCIKVDPILDPLRGNPRFKALMDKIIPRDST